MGKTNGKPSVTPDININVNGNGKPQVKRALILNMNELKRKIPDVKIAGPPGNVFHIACRISSEAQNFYRSLDVHPVKGGGVVIQSSWFENGNNAVSMSYHPELAIEQVEYFNGDEKVHKGPVLVRRKPGRWAFWTWVRDYIVRGVFGI